ncbi:dihydrofolate reductase family protein [Streptomyces marincola]|uniref:DNA-binding protein n=1 Tax=Streptomyces marincola TaxID=2878388 RepID=A0A1W7CUS1_9ACTN|nr:dihydrofolate reductase family protein [Streptomyces marincola]ARQ68541.1 DNA-binding protein [Streptomyces marincola]
MSKVAADISLSLDGFVTGPDAGPGRGLGTGGDAIHGWVNPPEPSPRDAALLDAGFAATGAVVMGRRTFDVIDGPGGWEGDTGYGYEQDQSKAPPNFVVTHAAPEHPRHRTGFTFVTDGVAAAVEAARAAAGDREVVIMGGADVIGQALTLGLVDELRIHLSPVLMGDGTRLSDRVEGPLLLDQADVDPTPHATHLTYRVRR